MKIGTRLGLGVGLVILLMIAIGAIALSQIDLLSERTVKMYRHPLAVSNAVRDVKVNIVSIHRAMKDVALAKNLQQIDRAIKKVDQYEALVFEEFELIQERFLGDQSKVDALITDFRAWKPIRDEVIVLMRQGEREAGAQITKGKGARHVATLNQKMEGLLDFAKDKGDQFFKQATETRKETKHFMILFMGIAVLTGGGITLFLGRSIARPIREIAEAAERIAAGDLSVVLKAAGKDEIGMLGKSFTKMVEGLRKNEALRVDAALSATMVKNSTNAMMFCDKDFKLVFMNPASLLTFRKVAHLLPCKPEEMVGQSIDIFHKGPEVIRRLLADETKLPYKGRIVIGDEILLLTATAMFDHQKNRIGTMANWSITTDSENLMKSLKGSSTMVSASSDELSESSRAMRLTAEETNRQAKTVATVSAQTNDSVQAVAAAAEEMAVTVREIAKRVQEANQISATAVSKAETMNTVITKLDESSSAIGKIVKVISNIAGQTNLLALNATIEAARAGAAGKGFAVVANEVKDLAKATESATGKIRDQIRTIQNNTKEAVEAITEISEIIEKNQEIALIISGAVEEQAATTDDISRNMSGAAKGADEVVREIENILAAAVENARGADNIEAASKQLAQMASQLAGLTGNQSEQFEEIKEAQPGGAELF